MHALKDNLPTALRRDPRRTAVFAALLILFGLLVVRRLGGLTQSAAGDAGLMGLVTAVPGGAASTAPAGAPNLSRGARLVGKWRQSPSPPVIRNLFASELNQPPARPADTTGAGAAQPLYRDEDGLFWRQLERALAERADREGFRARLAAQAVAEAGTLSVTSIVSGPESRALVSGRLVRAGDLIADDAWRRSGAFTVVAIETHRVVLARDGHRVSLTMGKAGAQLVTHE